MDDFWIDFSSPSSWNSRNRESLALCALPLKLERYGVTCFPVNNQGRCCQSAYSSKSRVLVLVVASSVHSSGSNTTVTGFHGREIVSDACVFSIFVVSSL